MRLTKLLEEYTRVEDLGEDSKYDCSVCKSKQLAQKMLRISICPKYMIILLKRFECDIYGNIKGKLRIPVIYPINDLDMEDYLSEEEKETPVSSHKYNLKGAVLHFGDIHGGHYVFDRFTSFEDPENGEETDIRFRFNDATIETKKALASDAGYILCYERV